MANTIKQRPLELIMAELMGLGLAIDGPLCVAMRDLITRADKTQTNLGEIQSQANVTGRTDPLSTTLTNVDSGGVITANGVDFTRAYLNKTTDNIADGTGTPLAGGKRGAIALNVNNRITSSLYQVPVSLNGAFTGSNPLTQSGITTTILVAPWTMQFGSGGAGDSVGGSVDPGATGTWYVYTDMPVLTLSFVGLTYHATANIFDLTANDGRICLGKIVTAGGGGGVGAGTGGGGNTGVRALV